MKTRIAIALGLLALPLPALSLPVLAGEPGPGSDDLMPMRVDGDITIDSQGRVAQYKVTTPVTSTIEKALDTASAAGNSTWSRSTDGQCPKHHAHHPGTKLAGQPLCNLHRHNGGQRHAARRRPHLGWLINVPSSRLRFPM